MEFVLVKGLEKEFMTVIVEDQMSKDQWFDDSEKNGWILVKEAEQIVAFELFRRFSINETNYDELAYLSNEPMSVESILDGLITEAFFNSQQEEVEEFLKGDTVLEKLILERKVKELELELVKLQRYKEETVWRLTEEDFIIVGMDNFGMTREEAEEVALNNSDNFNIDSWSEYVQYFIGNQMEQSKAVDSIEEEEKKDII